MELRGILSQSKDFIMEHVHTVYEQAGCHTDDFFMCFNFLIDQLTRNTGLCFKGTSATTSPQWWMRVCSSAEPITEKHDSCSTNGETS